MAKPWRVTGVLPSAPLREAARTIVATKYCEFLSYARAASDDPSEELAHDLRLAVKRLREALKLVHGGLPRKGARPARAAVNLLNERLGAVRDCDVFLRWVESLDDGGLSESESEALTVLRESVAIERAEHVRDLRHALGTGVYEAVSATLPGLVGRRRIREVMKRYG